MWEPKPYKVGKRNQIADVTGVGRLMVKPTVERARTFDGFINGRRVIVEEKTIEAAKRATEKVAARILDSLRKDPP
jgi:hypothetical protein